MVPKDGVRLPAYFVAVFAAACSESPSQPSPSSIVIVSGSGYTDTAYAFVTEPLVVEVRPIAASRLRPSEVQFEAAFSGNLYAGSELYVSAESGGPYTRTLSVLTDNNGQARVYVRVGVVAGQKTLTIRAPDWDLVTTASYTITPGVAQTIVPAPADSALYVGNSYRIRGSVADQWGNSRPDAIAFGSETPAISVDAAGLVTAQEIGRGAVVLSSGSLQVTARVSVVPPGTIAAIKLGGGGLTAALVFVNLDGSNYREFPQARWGASHPDWLADGTGVVMEDGGLFVSGENHLAIVDLNGVARRLIGAGTGVGDEFWPQQSSNGSWIYFAKYVPGESGGKIWRVKSDGTGSEQAGPTGSSYDNDTQPSPSPDGSRVAFGTNRICCYYLVQWVLNTASGAVDSLTAADGSPTPGTNARWSPDGGTVAYHNATTIYLMAPDGSGHRALTPTTRAYGAPFDWSADSRWILAPSSHDGVLHLIDAATGDALPLGFTRLIAHPAWRP